MNSAHHLSAILFIIATLQIQHITIATNPVKSSILNHTECSSLQAHCDESLLETPNIENSDFSVLHCLQRQRNRPTNRFLKDLPGKCQQILEERIAQLSNADQQVAILKESSKCDIRLIGGKAQCHSEEDINCILNNKHRFEDVDCIAIIDNLENVAFQSLSWIKDRLHTCQADAEVLSCAGKKAPMGASQSLLLSCLQRNFAHIMSKQCQKDLLKLSELQADSVLFDGTLWTQCQADIGKHCVQYDMDTAQILPCLVAQLDKHLSRNCRKEVTKWRLLIVQDYRISRNLRISCERDIERAKCLNFADDLLTTPIVDLRSLLLCLQDHWRTTETNNKSDGEEEDGEKIIEPNCRLEVNSHRLFLMKDYRLSKDIVQDCQMELKRNCSHLLQGEGGGITAGAVLHCLMETARKNRAQAPCQRALEALIEETDAAADWQIDPVVHSACHDFVETSCNFEDAFQVMSCLMNNLNSVKMTSQCHEALLQLHSIATFSYKFDAEFYRACRKDAINHCHATDIRIRSKKYPPPQVDGPRYEPEVMPCLLRIAFDDAVDGNIVLQPKCVEQLKRVIRQRSTNIDLQPDLKGACQIDLQTLCTKVSGVGSEMYCLQTNLERLQDDCRQYVQFLTKVEARYADLNPYISAHCHAEMRQLCREQFDDDSAGNLFDCLVENKQNFAMSRSCVANIEHFQLISRKDYRFTLKFRSACKHAINRYCEDAAVRRTTANDATQKVHCLSEHVTNAIVAGVNINVPQSCRKQLRKLLLQQRQNLQLDPELERACRDDIAIHCSSVNREAHVDDSQVLECLQTVSSPLKPDCGTHIFRIKTQQMYDNSVDLELQTKCSAPIQLICSTFQQETILECLKRNKEHSSIHFSTECLAVIHARMLDEDTNYLLNPGLQHHCKNDIVKHCSGELGSYKRSSNSQVHGIVVECLKKAFRSQRPPLAPQCRQELVRVIHEQALDLTLDSRIRLSCQNELATICAVEENNHSGSGRGTTLECLKRKFLENRLVTSECRLEISKKVEESEVDIEADPILTQTCAFDLLRHCDAVARGSLRRLMCLRLILTERSEQLEKDCEEMLRKRLKMYNLAIHYVPVDGLQQLYGQIASSPAKNYLLSMVFIVFVCVFMVGILFGRAFKRHLNTKNK